MSGALRLMDVPPDTCRTCPPHLVQANDHPVSTSLMWLLDGIASGSEYESREVFDLTLDSREYAPGSLFFALPSAQRGGTVTRLKFAADAAARRRQRGAVGTSARVRRAAAAGDRVRGGDFRTHRSGGRSRGSLLQLALSSQLRITGITGTNGKTTCAYLLAQCLERLGSQAAYMGTIGWVVSPPWRRPRSPRPMWSPCIANSAQLRASGVREVAMEVSSQALDQIASPACASIRAAFTNLSRDHLDYHGSMAGYGAPRRVCRGFPSSNTSSSMWRCLRPRVRTELRRTRAAHRHLDRAPASSGWLAERGCCAR